MPFAGSTRRRPLVAALAALALFPLLAVAETPGTVKVGNETKKAVGVLTDLQAGDVACYLTFKDDKGVEFQELADFDLCEKESLRGKRVALTYTMGNVMADECEGNPDCTKSKRVALVTALKSLDGKATPPKPAPRATPSQTSFCTPMEKVIFACRAGGKMVSVCASKDASRTKGLLEYRFGKPDSSEPLEITLPEVPTSPSKAATGENVPFAGGGGTWLRFHKGPYAYVVYSGIGRWGPNGETREKQGIVVEKAGKTVAHLKCTGELTSELGPDWYEAVGIQTNGEDFLFPD